MDLILSYNNREKVLTFPVVPNDGVKIESSQDNTSFDSLNGEMNVIGTKKLRSVSIESIFPVHAYPWLRPYSTSNARDYIDTIEDTRSRFIPFRVIVLCDDGSEMLNMPCTVDSFTYGPDRARDYAYSLTLREYRWPDYSV